MPKELMSVFDNVALVLRSVLQLPSSMELAITTPLWGTLPEFDSMAVVSVLTALEEHYDFFIHDKEITADDFETVGTLVNFVEKKLA
jgi:acyl carrier protein